MKLSVPFPVARTAEYARGGGGGGGLAIFKISGPGCSKLTTSLVNVSLKFQMLISNMRQYFC